MMSCPSHPTPFRALATNREEESDGPALSRTLSFPLLQLGDAKRRPPVLPPARPLISPASSGLLDLGCEGISGSLLGGVD